MSNPEERITRLGSSGARTDPPDLRLDAGQVIKKYGTPVAWVGGLLSGAFALLQAIDVSGGEPRTRFLLAAALAFGLLAIAGRQK